MFEDTKLYATDDPALRVLASVSTMTQWRHYGRGPAYTKIGHAVRYIGADLNAWIAAQRIEPVAA